jgi:hypothetical protein
MILSAGVFLKVLNKGGLITTLENRNMYSQN